MTCGDRIQQLWEGARRSCCPPVGTDDTSGYAPLLWQRGTAINLSTAGPCPGFSGFPIDINNPGEIVGYGSELRGDPPMMRGNYATPVICRDGVHSFLPPVGPLSGDNFPSRMNVRGEVVGRADPSDQRWILISRAPRRSMATCSDVISVT